MLVLLRKDVNSLKYLWIVKMCQGDLKKKNGRDSPSSCKDAYPEDQIAGERKALGETRGEAHSRSLGFPLER